MKYTANYNLKKPDESDVVNVGDLNDNVDIIDTELKKIYDKANNITVPVTSVNNKTGDVVLNANDVGAETPSAAQNKANAALSAAKSYTDQEVTSLSNTVNNKVDKVAGKGLSTNDYTDAEKQKNQANATELTKKLNRAGDTATGILKAHSNTSYTVAQVRNIILSANDADVNSMKDGEIWIKYK